MTSLSFHDYVNQVLPQKTQTKDTVMKYTQELCEALEKNHLSLFAQDESMNKSSFSVYESRKYFKIIESNPASWYQECVHIHVNKENGCVYTPPNKKIKFNLLDDQSRMTCHESFHEINAHLRLNCEHSEDALRPRT